MSKQSALRAPRWDGGDRFGFVAMSGPHSVTGYKHQSNNGLDPERGRYRIA
jgi:hypothetical protein